MLALPRPPLPPISLRIQMICIQVTCHQQFGALGELLESGDDTLYRQGVFGGELTSHDVPLPLPCRQLGANDVGSKLLDGLHRKIR